MSRASATFRQADVTRACKGVLAAGLTPSRAEIDKTGKIVMVFDAQKVIEAGEVSPLENWRRENGEG